MKKRLFIFIFLLGSTELIAQSVSDLVSTNFISLTVPIDYQGQLKYLNNQNQIEVKNITSVKHDTSLLSSLPNLVSSVTLYQVDQSGGLSLLGNTLSASNSTYLVIYDYSQTQTIQIKNQPDNFTYYALIGVSVRMIARVNTKKAGVNLADLFGIGVQASASKVTGSLEVRTSGINSLKINEIIPVTTDLSPSSISNALQSVATIKSHIYDPDTKITPQFLAFSAVKNSNAAEGARIDFKKLSESVKSFQFEK